MNIFPFEAIKFLSKLKRNNNKDWFESHRDEFNNSVLEPAQEFVVVLGELLRTFVPGIIAIPKTDKSIFRLHRDVRFSKDKAPYKTNLVILFWEGIKQTLVFYSGKVTEKRWIVQAFIFMPNRITFFLVRVSICSPTFF